MRPWACALRAHDRRLCSVAVPSIGTHGEGQAGLAPGVGVCPLSAFTCVTFPGSVRVGLDVLSSVSDRAVHHVPPAEPGAVCDSGGLCLRAGAARREAAVPSGAG